MAETRARYGSRSPESPSRSAAERDRPLRFGVRLSSRRARPRCSRGLGSAALRVARGAVLLVPFALSSCGWLASRGARSRPAERGAALSVRAAESPAAEPPCDLRVVTLNAAAGTGLAKLAWEAKLEGLADTIARSRADIVLLQEIDRGSDRAGGRDVLQELQRRMERRTSQRWYAEHGAACQLPGASGRGRYGNAILSRWPLSNVTHVAVEEDDSSAASCRTGREPRAVILAETAGLTVVSGHLASSSTSGWVDRAFARAPGRPVVVGMDINAGDEVANALARQIAGAVRDPGCSSDPTPCSPTVSLDDTRCAHAYDDPQRSEQDPVGQFDYIFVFPGATALTIGQAETHDPRGASDHMAVVVPLHLASCAESRPQ